MTGVKVQFINYQLSSDYYEGLFDEIRWWYETVRFKCWCFLESGRTDIAITSVPLGHGLAALSDMDSRKLFCSHRETKETASSLQQWSIKPSPCLFVIRLCVNVCELLPIRQQEKQTFWIKLSKIIKITPLRMPQIALQLSYCKDKHQVKTLWGLCFNPACSSIV